MIVNKHRRNIPFNSFLEKLKNDFIELLITRIFLKIRLKNSCPLEYQNVKFLALGVSKAKQNI
jgi:hypothetical protein